MPVLGEYTFPELYDPVWLRTQYLGWGKSQAVIAHELGCTELVVKKALRRMGVPRRDRRRSPMSESSVGTQDLRNGFLLRYLYEQRRLSLVQVAELLDSSKRTVHRAIKAAGIRRRANGRARHLRTCENPGLELSSEAAEFIDGELLGDGAIDHPRSDYTAAYSHSTSRPAYLEWLAGLFESWGIRQAGNVRRYPTEFGTLTWSYRSRSYPCLLDVRQRWYPWGRKIVPPDLVLTPVVVRQWYLGDGSLGRTEQGANNVAIAAHGFTIDERVFLVGLLAEVGIKASAYDSGAMYVGVHSQADFFDYIGPCPVECYQYKWPEERRCLQ